MQLEPFNKTLISVANLKIEMLKESSLSLSLLQAHERSHLHVTNLKFQEVLTHVKHAAAAKSLQSCLTLCDPIDGGPPGSPVPEILQARTLEWVAISFSSA